MTENEILKELNKNNPHPEKGFNDYKVGTEFDVKYKLYSWLTGEDCDRLVGAWFLRHQLKKINKNFTPQLYYDIVMLGITDISQRPVCSICGSKAIYNDFRRGYLKTCSKDCYEKLRDSRMSDQGKELSKLLQSKESREKQRLSHIGWVAPLEFKIKKSISMKKFYKTAKGAEHKERLKKLTSERNIKSMLNKTYYGGRTIGKYKTGIYTSPVWNKDFNYDSSWELNFIKYFENSHWKDEIKVFDRCLVSIPYLWEDGTEHRYLPDFYIKFKSGIQVVIELKPASLVKKDPVVLAKRIAAKKYFKKRGVKYLILTENEMYRSRHQKYTRLSESFGIVDSFNIYDYIV